MNELFMAALSFILSMSSIGCWTQIKQHSFSLSAGSYISPGIEACFCCCFVLLKRHWVIHSNVNRHQFAKRFNDIVKWLKCGITSSGLRNDLRTPDVRFIPCVTPLLGPSPTIESSDSCLGFATPALWAMEEGFQKLLLCTHQDDLVYHEQRWVHNALH